MKPLQHAPGVLCLLIAKHPTAADINGRVVTLLRLGKPPSWYSGRHGNKVWWEFLPELEWKGHRLSSAPQFCLQPLSGPDTRPVEELNEIHA